MKLPRHTTMSSADESQLMRLLMRLIEAKNVIEIGNKEISLA